MYKKTELLEAFGVLNEKNELKVGDVVELKGESFKSKMLPKVGQICVVTEVLEPPVLDTESGFGSPYFREKLDIKACLFDDWGALIDCHFDSRRFKHYTGE